LIPIYIYIYIKKNIPFEDKHDQMILVWDFDLWNGTNVGNHLNPTLKQINNNSSFRILVHHFNQNMKTVLNIHHMNFEFAIENTYFLLLLSYYKGKNKWPSWIEIITLTCLSNLKIIIKNC